MRHIQAYSVNEALFQGAMFLSKFGVEEQSRNGPVLLSPMPVITTYAYPRNRVLVNFKRDANPFFHLFEALWMLAGRNDLAFPAKFVQSFSKYSDDGQTLHGAYGYRWRNWFGYDQLELIIAELQRDPKTRRAVLAMWDGGAAWDTGDDQITGRGDHDDMQGDLHRAISGGKDVPCNTHAYFDTVGGKLNMTVCCRSNDIVFGAYGANAVHFSILLEYMAAMTGIPMGVYRQFSNNFHAYTELYPDLPLDRAGLVALADSVIDSEPYVLSNHLRPGAAKGARSVQVVMPLMGAGEQGMFHEDLRAFMNCVDTHDTGFGARSRFFQAVVGPMWKSWRAWKEKAYDEARQQSLQIAADDWRVAAQEWLATRESNRVQKKGVA